MSNRVMIRALVAGLLIIAAVIGCGGTSTNNDQGTAFLALGYFADSEGETGDTAALAILSPDSAVIITEPQGFQADGNQVTTFIGFQNRLANQFVRLERIECSYEIPGADPGFRIPDDSFNTATIIGPSPEADDRDEDTNQPIPLPTDAGSRTFFEFIIVSTDIMSYINVNRNLLPELPFRLIATCHGVAVTQSGDVIVSNDIQFEVRFFDQAECCTGAGTTDPDAAGAGGEVVGDDGGFQGGTGNGGGGGGGATGTGGGDEEATTTVEG